MTKFHGMLGYIQTAETVPGVHSEVVTEKPVRGDLLRDSRQWQAGEGLNTNLSISNRFSFVGDEYALANLPHIKYILWNGAKWAVSSMEIQRPRVILSVNGVYNG